MGRFWRWCVAVIVTAAVFGASAWLVGAVILPHVVEDHGDRWMIATALGVAIAALAGAWGYSFAGREDETRLNDAEAQSSAPSGRHPGGERSIMVKGDLDGIASTGENATNIQIGKEDP